MTGRILAIGDIHGCDTALERLLQTVAPTPDDTVVVLGDVVDRGPNVRRCIDLLLEVERRCRLVFLMGNHEEMMLDAAAQQGYFISGWQRYGGDATLRSYGLPTQFDAIPDAHWEFLRSGQEGFETLREIFVHAKAASGVPWHEQPTSVLRWEKLTGDEEPHDSGKRIVCGHTALRDGFPFVRPGWVCIDTFCYGGQWLTCLDVTTDTVWQANQRGELRGPLRLGDLAVETI